MMAHVDHAMGYAAWWLHKIRPAAFALTLAAIAIGITWAGLDRIPGPWEQLVAGFAFASAIIFFSAWATGSAHLMRVGYFMSVFLWVYVSWISIMALSTTPANWLIALAWASLSGGSYWLEESEHLALARIAGDS